MGLVHVYISCEQRHTVFTPDLSHCTVSSLEIGKQGLLQGPREDLKLPFQFFTHNVTHYVHRCHLALSVLLYENWVLGTFAGADVLAAAFATGNTPLSLS